VRKKKRGEVTAFTNCRGDEDIDAKRIETVESENPSLGQFQVPNHTSAARARARMATAMPAISVALRGIRSQPRRTSPQSRRT
jgi:hypothetical protein